MSALTLADRFALARSDDLTLGTLLERLAAVRPGRLLATEPDGWSLTIDAAAQQVARAAGVLAPDIEHGERVLVATPNGYRLFLAVLAVARAGGVAVPVNPKMADDEIAHVVADSGATRRIDDFDDLSEAGSPCSAVTVDRRGMAVLFYTSGTTGRPKGAELSHRALVGSVGPGALVVPGMMVRRGCVSPLPVAHIAGFSLLVQMAVLGVPVHLVPHFRPDDTLDRIEATGAMMVVGVPAMYRMMLEAGAADRDLSSVRLWSSAADAMPDEVAEAFQGFGASLRLPGGRTVGRATFVDGYGMVELGGGVATRVLPPVALPVAGALRPMRGNRVRVVDDAGDDLPHGQVGELLVRGPGTMRGYHGNAGDSDRTLDSDGWLRTGDLARTRRGGFFELAGRMKDVIKHGGYSVFAREVERTLEEHADVAEAAVLGYPDPRKGEVPVAVVRRRADATVTPDALVAFVAERLSDYKVPRQVIVVDELPRTGTDKVAKRELVSLFDEPTPI